MDNHTVTPWRLIPCLEASGAFHMALDLWLLEQHEAGLLPPTLRFYTWQPSAISLGYHQRHYPAEWNSLIWNHQPLDIVRRPSGGRAVLHQGDLTYAVITSDIPGTRMQAYETICQFLIEGWRSLGIPLQYGTAGRGYIHNPNCFGTATAADLVLPNHHKLIGSAQLRRGKTVLQHGSIPLAQSPDLFQQVFGQVYPEIDLPAHLMTEQAIPRIVEALTQAAQTCFNADFTVQPLSDWEWQQVEEKQ